LVKEIRPVTISAICVDRQDNISTMKWPPEIKRVGVNKAPKR